MRMVYYERDLSFYMSLYSDFIQNVLIKISTSIITFLALYRYFAVVYPMWINRFLKSKCVLLSIILITLFWICSMLPYLWSYEVETYDCKPNRKYFLKNMGVFQTNKTLRTSFNYFYAVAGFFIPVCVLAFCNVHLITVVHASNRRTNLARLARQGTSTSQLHYNRMRMNITLIVIIVAFFCFVLPGELLLFIQDMVSMKNLMPRLNPKRVTLIQKEHL